MGTILVMPIKAAKMKLEMMAASLHTPFRIPNAVPLREGVETHMNLYEEDWWRVEGWRSGGWRAYLLQEG